MIKYTNLICAMVLGAVLVGCAAQEGAIDSAKAAAEAPAVKSEAKSSK